MGYNFASTQGTLRTNLTYQIRFADSWAVGNVYLDRKGEGTFVLGSHFQPVSQSLEAMNRFSLRDKTPTHYAVFAVCLGIPLFVLYVLVVCIRSRIRRKWLWILFILIGVCQVRFNWTTGQLGIQPISVLVLGASAFREGLYSAWVLGCAAPLGAIIFLARRRKLSLPEGPSRI